MHAVCLGSTDEFRHTLVRKIEAAFNLSNELCIWLDRFSGFATARPITEALFQFLTLDLQAQVVAIDSFKSGPTIDDLSRAQSYLESLRTKKESMDSLCEKLKAKGVEEMGDILRATAFPGSIEEEIEKMESEVSNIQKQLEAKQ